MTREQALRSLTESAERWHAAARRGIAPGTLDTEDDADHVRGDEGGLEVVEYGNYLNVDCVSVRADLASSGPLLGDRVRFAYRHFLLSESRLELALLTAEAAEAAAAQGRFWEMHARLLDPEAEFGDRALRAHARAAGLDLARFDAELADGTHLERVLRDVDSGLRAGVDGTPTFFIGGTRVDGGYEEDELAAALGRALGDPGLARQLTSHDA